ncbi:DegT/DnrJ/EryC1/StrS aminotransferase family protein [Roseovarius spongiae]|uniref:DegT/DnrJ/EryC1/StrS aminotransferase family protein n=1 Tax=Roseovarius spongiae TaxID=2320272 RepID=A0A3A8AUF9_9RHOB|nr:DegT/DnrJ/EryC1/StrS aminotransferase family protein [Roseovarius spongiae]RKF15314.1 DegT/DnrJ/EryC1/StrS aminotransferase family protein [Roseovarius spongiae]
MIPVFRPSIDDDEINAVTDAMRSGWIGLGPRTAEFEERFAAFCGVPHAVGLNSGTAALDLAMRLLEIGEGDEVVVPTMTFVSTAHVVALNRATPVFADSDPVTLNIDPNDVARKITPRTRAVIVTHYSGRPVDLNLVAAAAPGLPIIEDCAHAAGATFQGAPVGGIGVIGCFSFHAVKNLSSGEGGMLTTRNAAWAKRAHSLRWLGIDRSTWKRAQSAAGYRWRYSVTELGLKCHMNDIAAAMGLVQLRRLAELNARRRSLVSRYRAGLSGIAELSLPPQDDETFRSSWHLFCIQCERRDALGAYLAEHGVGTGVHYIPIHTHECYGRQPPLPVAEDLGERILTLPLYPDLQGSDVDRITGLIQGFYRADRGDRPAPPRPSYRIPGTHPPRAS